jgi:hypothetical protein
MYIENGNRNRNWKAMKVFQEKKKSGFSRSIYEKKIKSLISKWKWKCGFRKSHKLFSDYDENWKHQHAFPDGY